MTIEPQSIKVNESLRNILEKVGIQDIGKFKDLLDKTDWVNFAEDSFCDADDVELPLRLYKWQKMVVRKVQKFFYNNRSKNPDPTMKQFLQIIAPRGRGKSVVIGVINAIILIIGKNATGVFSPSQQQSENLMSKTKYFIENSKFSKLLLPKGRHIAGMQKVFTGAASVGMKNRSFSQAWANNEVTMRGIHLAAAFVDESARMSSHTMKAAIYPMLRTTHGPLICITTPFGRAGPAWEAYNDSEIWETVMIKSIDEEFMTPEELERQLAAYGPDQQLARQELLSEFISDEHSVFKDKYFEKLYMEPYYNFCPPSRMHTYFTSSDYGWTTNRAVLMAGHWEENTSGEQYIMVDHIKSYLNPDPDVFEDDAISLMKLYSSRVHIPDGISVGAGEVKRLQKRIKKEKLKTRIFKSGERPKHGAKDKRRLGMITQGGSGEYSKMNLVDEAIYRMNKGQLRLPNDALKKEDNEDCYELEKELKAYGKKITLGGNVTFGKTANKVPDDRVATLLYLIFMFSFSRRRVRSGVGSAQVDQAKLISDTEKRRIFDRKGSVLNDRQIGRNRKRKGPNQKNWGI